MKLTTATGKEYEFGWVGQSSIDGGLFFLVNSNDLPDLITTFSNPEETIELTFVIDSLSEPKIYKKFVQFNSAVREAHGNGTTIGLGRKWED